MTKARSHDEFYRHRDAIAALPLKEKLEPGHLLKPQFRLERIGEVEVYYAPIDCVNRRAEIVLAGITPGWQQMEIAYRVAREAILRGAGPVAVCRRAKRAAAFSGTMRENLLEMLDGTGVPKALGIVSSEELFNGAHNKLHSTSVLRYPVFVGGKNYTGHQPPVLRHPVLKRYVDEVFSVEVAMIPEGFIVPLGQAVSNVLQYLADQGILSRDRCCFGFPHPSGANGHRREQFQARRRAMTRGLRSWFHI
ncbi:MAG: hypothetical protein SWQ30_14410 [Thermodesulfobacteriota bacterium]|nr:hypothetical protein [Thermodesulfobacteriota bacterium]